MPAAFDRHSSTYEAAIEQAIGFAGQPHDVYVEAKARRLLELARRRLGADPGEALDVGCGIGLVDRHVGSHVRSLHGVDVSRAVVERARQANADVEYAVYDGRRLPYDAGKFDLVFAVCVLHHVRRTERPALLAEMARVTRPGGLVVVFEHNPWNPLTRKAVRGCAFDEGAELLSLRQLVGAMRRARLDPVDADYLLFVPWRMRFVEAIERRLTRVPLGAQYVVAARRPGA